MLVISDWQQEILKATINAFHRNDVYNLDETSLRLLPNKTLASKGKQCTLLVIRKYVKPRCFKNAKIPVDYKANCKVWMTAPMYETWLKDWDKKLEKDGRKRQVHIYRCDDCRTAPRQ